MSRFFRLTNALRQLVRPWVTLLLATTMAASCTSHVQQVTEKSEPSHTGPVHRRANLRLDSALDALDITAEGRLRPATVQVGAASTDDASQTDPALKGAPIDPIALKTEAVLQNPDRADAYEDLGRALVATKHKAKARAALRTALDLEPARIEARFLLAQLLQASGAEGEAITELTTLLGLAPDHGASHGRLAVLYHYAGDGRRARHHLDMATHLEAPIPGALRRILREGAPRTARTVEGLVPTKSGGFIGPQVQVDSSGGRRVEETSASAGPFNASELVAAWHDYPTTTTLRLAAGISSDGGQTWSEHGIRPLSPTETQGDPMTATDPRTGDQWVGGIAFGQQSSADELFVAHRAPGAPSFETAVTIASFSQGLDLDKAMMVAGRKHGAGNESTTRLYVVVKRFNNMRDLLYFSDPPSTTWSDPPGEISPPLTGLLPRIGPAGELFILGAADEGPRIQIVRNFNSGEGVLIWERIADRMAFWSSATDFAGIPGEFRVPHFSYLAVDPLDSTLYVVYFDVTSTSSTGEQDIDLYFMRSTNQGKNWSDPVVILDDDGGAPNPMADQFFPWIEVDDRGRIHIVYWDSRNVAQNDNDSVGWFDTYYAISSDRGDSWTRFRLTPASFSTANVHQVLLNAGFVGDYTGMAVAGGVAHPVYVTTQQGDLDVFTNTIDFGLAPVARDDYYFTTLDDTLEISASDPLLNDDNLASGILVCSTTQPANGTLTLVEGGFQYQPSSGFVGVDSFDYTACGPAGASTATIHLEIFSGLSLRDDFEDGINPPWQVVTAGSGAIVADSSAALQGGQGLRPSVGALGDTAYLKADIDGPTVLQAAFHLDPQAMTMNAFTTHVIFEGYGNVDWLFHIQASHNGQGVPRIRARIKDAAGAITSSAWVLVERPVAIEIGWQALAFPNPSGGVALTVDGQLIETLVSDNGVSLAQVRLGAIRGIPAGTIGAHAMDSFVASWVLTK